MPLVYPNMQMSEVVEEHPSLIPVINRFGIRLGLGDKSVKAICEETNALYTHSPNGKGIRIDELPSRALLGG